MIALPLKMSGFPDNFRDLTAFSGDGLDYSTSSNTAVKMFDALVHQAIYHYASPQYEGWAGTVREMFSADPEFAMGRIMTSTLDLFAVNPKKTEEPRKKLIDLSKSSQASKITDLEKLHLDAALLLTVEDYKGAMDTFERILAKYPRDAYALQMAYFLALTTGHTAKLRDIPASVVTEYSSSTPFYGHVHGKLCFGQGETGDYVAGELSGRLALDYLPLDNWAHHALAHNFEESGRPLQGAKFLSHTEDQWTQGTTFSSHLWWHEALLQLQLGNTQAALDLYDNTVGPRALKDGGSFPLSDASALLMRLHLAGAEVGDRARQLAPSWEKHNEDFVSLFYDGHNCFNSLLAGDRVARDKLLDNMRDFINDNRTGWNKDVVTRLGVQLLQGITEYFDGEYNKAVEILSGIMSDLQGVIQGSTAQKDVFRQILLDACIRSGSATNLALARDIIDKRMVDMNLKSHTPANQRMLERILLLC